MRRDEQKTKNLLQFISYTYDTKEATEKLASELLDGKEPGGGAALIPRRILSQWPTCGLGKNGLQSA